MKKKNLLILLFLSVNYMLQAQTLRPVQWASSVIEVSSEFNPTPGTFSAVKLLGAPEFFPQCGSNGNCWAPATQNGSREFFVVGFATPQPVNTVRIYQSWGPGAVDTVYLRNAATSEWTEIYQATAVNQAACPGTTLQLLEIVIPTTAYDVDAVRVAINSPLNTNWNEFDAVSIANFDLMNDNYNQYASGVIDFSSEFNASPGNFSAQRALGIPDASASCASHSNAWASATENGQREHIVVSYAYPAKVNRVMIHQQEGPGAVDTVYLREFGTNIWHQVYQATAAVQTNCIASKYLEINFTKTEYYVDAVRIAVNSPGVTGYNEIDAIGIQSELPPTAKRSVQTGNWSDGATWTGGTVPTAADTVIIGLHTITLDANGTAAAIVISNGGTLNISTSSILEVGPFNIGGGNKTVDVQGVFNMSNGTLNIGGMLKLNSGASFAMGGGDIAIDGNDGTSNGSIPDVQYLTDFPTGLASFSFTGGSITLIDPPFGSTGNTIRSVYNFGAGTTVRFGNGISTTSGGNANGFFINSNSPSQMGSIIVDATITGSNRKVTLGRTITLNGDLVITSGLLQNNNSMTVTGIINNNGSFTISSTARTNGTFTNNGTTNMTNGSFSIGNNFINTPTGVYTVTGTNYTSVNGNVTNNGSFTSNWLFFADNFNTASTNAQTIGGTGSFNIYGLEIRNSNAAGVTPQLSLVVQEIYFREGKISLGNNDLTFSSTAAGYGTPGANNYVVTDGTGRLIFTNLSASEILFPIGTAASYTPVRIANGSGHAFSCNVQSGFTNPHPTDEAVQRQWNITDVTGGAVSATLTLQWNEADEHASFNRNSCAIAHYGGGWSSVGSAGPASGTNPYTKTATNVSTFSPFTVSSNSVVLPVTLVRFNATKENNKTKLIWETASEINFSHFEIERSTDGINYASIATINARNIPGNHTYDAYDANSARGLNFYRLKMVDIDTRYKYSQLIRVNFDKPLTVTISPNPASGEMFIQSDKKISNILLTDISGRTVKQFLPSSDNRYDITEIKTGIYFVRVYAGENAETIRLLVK